MIMMLTKSILNFAHGVARRRWWCASLALSGVVVLAAAGWGQGEDADDDTPEAAQEEVDRFVFSPRDFDNWVFQHGFTAAKARQELERRLQLHLEDLERIGPLTDAERKKALLAGQGDIQRFFDDYERRRVKFVEIRHNSDGFGNFWDQTIRPLQRRYSAGLFGEDSLWRKSLPRTLRPEHAAKFDQQQRDRRTFYYRAKVEWVVAMLDNVMPLRESQRQALIELLVKETKQPRTFGEYDHYVILWQMSRLPEEKFTAILDEGQWKSLARQFKHVRGYERLLQREGRFVLEGENPSDAPPAAEKPRG